MLSLLRSVESLTGKKAMKQAMSSIEKGFSRHTCVWRYTLVAGLLSIWVAAMCSWSLLAPTRVLASTHLPTLTANFRLSPSSGPVGTVIMVHITNLNLPNGTKVQLGEMNVFASTCTLVADSQGGTVQTQAFSGWLRWPDTTSTGFFQVCARADSRTVTAGFSGFFEVLSTIAPQVTVTPTTLTVDRQATITGTNFLPAGTSVNLLWHAANGSQAISLGTATSDATGSFTQAFTVPANSNTGTYMITATVGSNQPPTLSASTTFHVNGITIVAVPTPTATSSPTATATVSVTSTASTTPVRQSTKSASRVPTTSSMVLPLVSGGLFLIVAALLAGVLIVRRQRELAALAGASKPAWSEALAMSLRATFPLRAISHPDGFREKSTLRRVPALKEPPMPDISAIPFDPALAEAMRQAQVSLFATPRPPVDEKVPLS